MKGTCVALLLGLLTLPGCFFLVGAGAAGGGYEYVNKRKLEELDEKLERGEISREEYLRRKQEIQKGSVVY